MTAHSRLKNAGINVSQVTHVAQCVVFGAVMADAAMLDAVLVIDVWARERGMSGVRMGVRIMDGG